MLNILRAGLLLIVVCAAVVRADTLILHDGTKQEGTIVEEDNSSVTLKLKFGQVRFKKNEIKEIIRSSAEAASGDAATFRDVLKLKNGSEHVGLLVSDDGDVEIDLVASGKAVSKTILVRTRYAKDEVASVKKLTDAQRKAAREYIDNVQTLTKQDAVAETQVQVLDVSLPTNDPDVKWNGRKIELEFCTIISNADAEFLKRAAYRLGRVFAAYKQHFGMPAGPQRKFTITIFNSMDEYRVVSGGVRNPAFYSIKTKEIFAACNIETMGQELNVIRERHAVVNAQLEEWRVAVKDARARVQSIVSGAYEELNRGGKGTTPDGQRAMDRVTQLQRDWQLRIGDFDQKIAKAQEAIVDLNRRNEAVFNNYTKEMFLTLYHEGFHAFADLTLFDDNYSPFIPRWLHEGLAQYFEVGRLEGNRFVLGVEDRNRIAILRRFQRENALMSLDQLLGADEKDFLVHGSADVENSTRSYLQSWLLVHILGENKRLTRENLQAFIGQLASGKKVLEVLPKLSGMPNADLEKAMTEYLKPKFER